MELKVSRKGAIIITILSLLIICTWSSFQIIDKVNLKSDRNKNQALKAERDRVSNRLARIKAENEKQRSLRHQLWLLCEKEITLLQKAQNQGPAMKTDSSFLGIIAKKRQISAIIFFKLPEKNSLVANSDDQAGILICQKDSAKLYQTGADFLMPLVAQSERVIFENLLLLLDKSKIETEYNPDIEKECTHQEKLLIQDMKNVKAEN